MQHILLQKSTEEEEKKIIIKIKRNGITIFSISKHTNKEKQENNNVDA